MSTVITMGAIILMLAFLAMFLLSRWQLRTIGLALVGVTIVYVGAVALFSNALDAALKRRSGPQQVDLAPHKVVESDRFQAPTNGEGGVKTNAPWN